MKRCPECRRDYFDDSLVYCLDDGARLLEGPAPDEHATAVIPSGADSSEAATRTFDDAKPTGESLKTNTGQRAKSKFIVGMVGAAVIIAVLAWAGYNYYDRGSQRQIESIAVLPFVNTGGNPDIEYLSDGITESLINSLSQIPSLSVKASSSVFTYKGKEVTLQQVARDLSVQAVVNGRVIQRGDQVVLNVQLVDAGTGNNIWGDQYTRKITDIVQLQSEIARDVSSKLREKLTGAEQQRVARNYTENTEAYQLYLRGRHHWSKRKGEDIRKSIEYFQQAIDNDPSYALAYAALAEGYILFPNYRLGSPADYYPKARAAAMKAIEIDDSLAEAHNALACVVSNYDWKFAEAEAEWRKTLALNPSYATARQWYSEYLLAMGRNPEALAEMQRAKDLDPLSLIINGMLGVTLRMNGRHEEALDQLRKTIEMDPSFPPTRLYLFETYQDLGRYEEAIDEMAQHFILTGGHPEKANEFSGYIKKAYRADGPKGFSRAVAELLERFAMERPAPVSVRAGYWARAGEIDKAFALLEKAYEQRDDSLLMIKDPHLDPIRSDPRYRDLLRRIGLPE